MLQKTKTGVIIGVIGVIFAFLFFGNSISSMISNVRFQPNENEGGESEGAGTIENTNSISEEKEEEFQEISLNEKAVEVFQDELSVPWALAKIDENSWVISERSGNLFLVENGERTVIQNFQNTRQSGEGGLLGITLHPNFEENAWLYLYQTQEISGEGTTNRILRFRYENNSLQNETTIIENIPGALYHDGGRIAFGPDGYLYIATGDATEPDLAQDTTSLAGKILRIKDDGSIPEDNPFGNAVYSYGHRNPQGLTWDDEGNLWSSEHGRSGALSGFDELNKILPGGNYGWPEIEGDEKQDGMITPELHSGPDTTWAPGGLTFVNGNFFWGGLRGQTLYQAYVDENGKIEMETRNFSQAYGRLRTTFWDEEENTLYFMTSNDDGRNPDGRSADKILKVQVQ